MPGRCRSRAGPERRTDERDDGRLSRLQPTTERWFLSGCYPKAEDHGIQYAMELSGHTSSVYIWRRVKPPKEQIEQAIEGLF